MERSARFAEEADPHAHEGEVLQQVDRLFPKKLRNAKVYDEVLNNNNKAANPNGEEQVQEQDVDVRWRTKQARDLGTMLMHAGGTSDDEQEDDVDDDDDDMDVDGEEKSAKSKRKASSSSDSNDKLRLASAPAPVDNNDSNTKSMLVPFRVLARRGAAVYLDVQSIVREFSALAKKLQIDGDETDDVYQQFNAYFENVGAGVLVQFSSNESRTVAWNLLCATIVEYFIVDDCSEADGDGEADHLTDFERLTAFLLLGRLWLEQRALSLPAPAPPIMLDAAALRVIKEKLITPNNKYACAKTMFDLLAKQQAVVPSALLQPRKHWTPLHGYWGRKAVFIPN